MIAKIHKNFDGGIVLAVCDSDLIGKKFKENKLQLDLSSDFYKGEEMDVSRIKELLKVVSSFNLVGKESVTLGIEENVVNPENVKIISGISYVIGVIAKE